MPEDKRVRYLVVVVLALFITCSACSPLYIARAGWEEAKILWKKEPIEDLLQEDLPPELKKTLSLVSEVREFSSNNGLKPGGSYTEYSDIGRDVLVWVLSAAQKHKLQQHTWWFPVVGNVPYKGFFDKEDGIEAANKLKKDGLDIYLRPSPAFSTLGWLDDPFLSTMNSGDEISIANVIIHEILHNTLWIKGSASFNETMANVTGAVGAIHFFEERDGKDSKLAIEARNRYQDEIIYSKYLSKCIDELNRFYKASEKKYSSREHQLSTNTEFLEERGLLFQSFVDRWDEVKPKLKSKVSMNFGKKLNNAVILSRQVYYDRYNEFSDFYLRSEKNFKSFVEDIKKIKKQSENSESDIWSLLSGKLQTGE